MGISCAVCNEKRKGGSRVWAGRELINPYPTQGLRAIIRVPVPPRLEVKSILKLGNVSFTPRVKVTVSHPH
jgi:hypothetical protein